MTLKKFLMRAEVNCGVAYEVEANDHAEAELIMRWVMIDHINNGCDGLAVHDLHGLEISDVEEGVRVLSKDGLDGLVYYDHNLEKE